MSPLLWLAGAAICALQQPVSPGRSVAAAASPSPAARSGVAARRAALQYAMRHNPTLRLTKARRQSAVARQKGAQVFPNNPVLSAGGGAQLPVSAAGQGTSGVLPRASASLSLAIPVGGRWSKAQRQAQARVRWRKQALALRQFQLQLQVHQAINETIFAWLAWRQRLAIAAYFQKVEGLTRQRIKYGSAKLVELSYVQASRLQAQQGALSAGLGWRTARQLLQRWLGWRQLRKPMPWRWQAFPPLPALSSLKVLQRKAQSQHPSLALLQASIALARAGVRLSEARAIPDLTVSVGYAMEDNQHVVQGALSIPLPLFWRGQSAIAASRGRWRQARLSLARAKLRRRQRVRLAFTRLRAQQKMGALLKQRANALAARSKMLEKGLRQGGFSVFQVLTTQRSILQSRLLQLQNTRRIHSSYIALCRAVGMSPGYRLGGAP